MNEGEFLFWIALGFAIVCCIGMYLVTRWTRPPRIVFGEPRDIYAEVAEDVRQQQQKMRKRFEEPRPRLGADETLRRHLLSSNPKRKTRVP